MKKLEEAAQRLDRAVKRLEAAASGVGAGDGDKRLQEALAAAKAEYATLEEKIERVTTRLDGTIERINTTLDD